MKEMSDAISRGLVFLDVEIIFKHILGAVKKGISAILEDDLCYKIGIFCHEHAANRAFIGFGNLNRRCFAHLRQQECQKDRQKKGPEYLHDTTCIKRP